MDSNCRISLDLSEFFDDIRKLSYISVDLNQITMIGCLIQRVQYIFGIEDALSFTINGHYIPNSDSINMIRKDDILKVHRVNFVDAFTKKKKRNKEKSKENEEDIIPSKRKKLIDDPTQVNGINEITKHKEKINKRFLENENREKIENKTNLDLSSQNNTLKNSNTIPDSLEKNSIEKKKRKRYRKRKKKIDNSITETFNMIRTLGKKIQSDNKNKKNENVSSKNSKHLRFSTDSENEDHENVEKLNTIENINNGNLNDSVNEKIIDVFSSVLNKKETSHAPLIIKRASSTIINNENKKTKKINSNDSYYDQLQVLKESPKANMTIAFKILKLNENYTPHISEYIKALVLSYADETSEIKLKILDGFNQFENPKGKFDIENSTNEEQINEERTIHYLNWNELIETKIIDTPND